MKKYGAICIIIFLLLSLIPVSALAAESQDASVLSGCNTFDGYMPLLGNQQLVHNTRSAFVYEVNTDTLMYSFNADEQVPPASLLKILTALIAIEKGSMTDVVTVRSEVLATLPNDAAVVELAVDEVLTVQDLLYCMMVGSGNDAAVVLADHILGSQEAFVAEMNCYAQELNCTGTNFTNVHGLHDKEQYTTARDMAKILARAMKNAQFMEVFGARYYSVPQTNKADERHLATQNYLLNNDNVVIHYDTRVTGSRTAVANDNTRSIASSAKIGDMELICIVIGAKSQYEKDGYTVRVFGGYDETKKLLDLGFSGYKTTQIIHENQVIQQYTVPGGSSDLSVGTATSAYSVIPENIDTNSLTFRFVDEAPLTAPISKGQRVATLQVWVGNVCIAQSELTAMNQVVPANEEFQNENAKSNGAQIGKILLSILGGAVVAALLGCVALVLIRVSAVTKAKRRSRRNSRDRRRSR